MDASRTELSWSGWGDPAQARPLPAAILGLLRDGLGVSRPNPVPTASEQVELEPIRLAPKIAAGLVALVGDPYARHDHEARLRHALGKSTLDLLALRAGRRLPAPDLVLLPGSHDEVLAVLKRCAADRVAVVPFGGGTSVVGGLVPEAEQFSGVVALDLLRLNDLAGLDEESRLARLGPGLRGPEAEALVGARGYTIGHFPQSFEYATLGGFAAARSSGQASAGYGRFDELVMGLRVATPAGTLDLGRSPKSAAGPDLRQLILGSEGALGVITELTVQVRPVPASCRYDGWRLESFAVGQEAVRRLTQDGPRPTVLRLSDEAETALGLAAPDQLGSGGEGGSLAIVGYEGTDDEVQRGAQAAAAVLRDAGATPVPAAGPDWNRGRFHGPYLRDALLDAGALVETLETAAFWSALPELYRAVTRALTQSLANQGTPAVILCHVSHVYLSGASLYFTVACAQREDATTQWREAKAAAMAAIGLAGGSISHHHGVGRDHRAWLVDEIGQLGVAALTAVKRELDPTGVMNPGILVAS
ncbi:MAG: alkyldihydroxyacetonephosphate synthase [Solirubrobacteraceae bacterium]|nr:alkyldihydroxyacetonephosphate synthase [Solirubrobacteraceae bacterium]